MKNFTIVLLISFFSLLTTNILRARDPLPKDLKLARQQFARAKAEETAAKKAILSAKSAEHKLQVQLADSIEKDKRFENLMSQLDSVSSEFEGKHKEREKWQSPPSGWVEQQKELRRKWNILANHRKHVEDGYWKKIDRDLKLINKELENWHKKAQQKRAAIDREMARLVAKRKQLEGILPSVVDVRLDNKLLAKWTISLAQKDKANRRAQQAEKQVLKAYDDYLQIASSLGPAHVKEVTLLVGNKVIYRAKWKQLHPESQKELDEEEAALLRKALRKKIQKAEREISYIEMELDDNSKERLKLALEMRAPTRELEKAAERYSEALLNKVYAQIAIESATVVVEVALTGGTATLARKGAELAEKTLVKRMRSKLVESAKASRRKYYRFGANAVARKWTTAKVLQASGTPNADDPVAKEVQAVALGESLEGFLGTLALPALDKSISGFRKASSEGAWRRIRAGMTSGRQFFNVKSVKGALFDRANIAGIAGSVTKTLATAHFAAKAQQADLDFWSTYAKLSAMYKVYYVSLSADYKVWQDLQKRRKQVAAARTIYSGLLWKRRLVVTKSEVLTEGEKAGTCLITFSTPLTVAPMVKLGAEAIKMTAQGSLVSGLNYKGTFSRDSLPSAKSRLTLAIEAGHANLPYRHIDGNPATPAHLPLNALQFHGFEKQRDRNYEIKVKGSAKEKESESFLIDQQKFTKVTAKYIFKEHPIPPLSAKDIPTFKGRLAMLYRDASGKYGSVNRNIHRVGDKRPLIGTWRQVIDLTPGTYDIYATGPTPAIKATSIMVQRGRLTKVALGGYGRLKTFCRDGLGKKASSNMIISRAGSKKPLLGTWSESIELAPGTYDIVFTSYEPDIEHKGFQVKKGYETKVEAFGYGRIHLSIKDGLGKETASNIVVRKSGSEKNLLGTWQKNIDLPPGKYDLLLTSFEPDMVITGVQVRKHQQTNILADGYGRIHLSIKDGLGKEAQSNIVVRKGGSEKNVLGTWQKNIDLPPGIYDLLLTSFEPDMAIRGVQVRKHQQTNAIGSGYGRIFVDCRDQSGKSSSVHIAVHRAGQKKALLGTWSSKIDLPPGRYDLHFATGGDGKWARGVNVQAKSQTPVRVRR